MLRNTGEEDKEVANGDTGGPEDARASGLATVLLQEYDADSLREGDKVPACSIRTHSALRSPSKSELRVCLGELRRFHMCVFSGCASGLSLHQCWQRRHAHTCAHALLLLLLPHLPLPRVVALVACIHSLLFLLHNAIMVFPLLFLALRV